MAGQGGIFLDELRIGDARMVNVMNQGAKRGGKLRQGVRRDAVGMFFSARRGNAR